jgi:hypothetical protein
VPDETLPTHWRKLSVLSGLIASIVVPVVIARFGHQYAKAIKEREIQGQFVELAVGILQQPPRVDSVRADSAIRTWASNVLSKYSGVPMPPELVRKLQGSQLPGPVASQAAEYERRGFQYLFENSIDSAIVAFEQADKAYPTYHSVFEIGRFLERRRQAFASPRGRRETFDTIQRKYSWQVPRDLLDRVREEAAAQREP